MDALSDRLGTRRYLVGDSITEADVRLWVTLVRFDAVYHGHFKCNRNKLTKQPVLWAYGCTPASTRRGSCRSARMCQGGRRRTAARSSVGARSETTPPPGPPPADEAVPLITAA